MVLGKRGRYEKYGHFTTGYRDCETKKYTRVNGVKKMSEEKEKGKTAEEIILQSLVTDFDDGVGKFTLKYRGKKIKGIEGRQ